MALVGAAYWKFAIPVHRVEMRSELIMEGDLDGDRKWAAGDLQMLEGIAADPFAVPAETAAGLDMNQNGLLDGEDLEILRQLVASGGDPYAAEAAARAAGRAFPRPRELYRYRATGAYRQRPLLALPYERGRDSVLPWLGRLPDGANPSAYARALDAAIYDESVRFDLAWRLREPRLRPDEREYAARKLRRARALFEAGERYELLLALMELVEDAETLTTRESPEFTLRLLKLRDHLRDVLGSPLYAGFSSGKQDWRAVLRAVSDHVRADTGLVCDLETMERPRSLTNLENYVQRAEWQYYKSTTRREDFAALIEYAQHDRRYLHAVARTNRRLRDTGVENHNLPMVLLFREALAIKGNDKKRAVGLLDEAIRIPYAWIKSIPREALPASLALDNFLLPGNMEDGADKSRHWNVFGGICLYKSPREALELALKREMQDLREGGYTEAAMREFLRDMIANLNGMYHVTAVNPALLGRGRPRS